MSYVTDLRPDGLPSGRKTAPSRNNVLYCAKIFFLLSGIGALGIIDRFTYGEWEGKTGSSISRILNLIFILSSIFIYWSSNRKAKGVGFNRFIPLAAATIPLMSLAWSVDPGVTFRQGTQYFFAVLGAIGLAETSDGDELMRLLCLVCSVSAAASLVQFFLFPDLPGTDLRGIFPQKNVLGQVMVGGVIAGMHGVRLKRGPFRYICAVALCSIVALMSKSGTSIFAIFILFGIDILGRLYLKKGVFRRMSVGMAVAIIPFAIYFLIDSDLILDALGKDRSLTGRTLIWPYVIDAIRERPIFGWGFWAFWSPVNPRSFEITREVGFGFSITSAHNGLLEFLLQIGVIGTALFLFIWLRNFVLAAKSLRVPGGQFAISTIMVLTSIAEIGVSEEVLVSAQQIWTILFFATGLICEKQLWLARDGRKRAWPRTRGN